MASLSARTLVIIWMAGFAGSFAMQSVFQRWFAENAAWGPNRGWQNEIAISNLGVLVALANQARRPRASLTSPGTGSAGRSQARRRSVDRWLLLIDSGPVVLTRDAAGRCRSDPGAHI